jgi:RNA polymerase sigma-70 factor (ECF subfamily)
VAGARKDRAEERERFAREAMSHLDHLYRVAYHLAKKQEDAQDIVQETYVRALAAREQFALGTNMKAWLTRILYNFFYDHYRERRRWLSTEVKSDRENEGVDFWDSIQAQNPGPESQFLRRELNVQINEALKLIPEEFRMPIIFVDLGDLSYTEAAEILSCPVGTIRSRLSRGRRLLHKHLNDYVRSENKGEKTK